MAHHHHLCTHEGATPVSELLPPPTAEGQVAGGGDGVAALETMRGLSTPLGASKGAGGGGAAAALARFADRYRNPQLAAAPTPTSGSGAGGSVPSPQYQFPQGLKDPRLGWLIASFAGPEDAPTLLIPRAVLPPSATRETIDAVCRAHQGLEPHVDIRPLPFYVPSPVAPDPDAEVIYHEARVQELWNAHREGEAARQAFHQARIQDFRADAEQRRLALAKDLDAKKAAWAGTGGPPK